MNAAGIIAKRLYQAGCRSAFGVPGGEVLSLIDMLEHAGIRFVLCKHENAAGFMAEASWHATGAPGVLVATLGPGIANAANAIANASQERVPLIVLAGAVDMADALSYNHQVFDHRAVFAPLCKATFTACDGATDVVIDKAIGIAMEGRPGPVLIDLPVKIARTEQPDPRPARYGRALLGAPASGTELARAQALFSAAERPLVVAGLDVLNETGCATAVTDFARRHAIPVITTYKAKGIIPEDDPLAMGGHGLSPKSDEFILPLVHAADLVIALGYDPIEMRPGWQNPWDPARAISFAHAPDYHDMHHAEMAWTCSIVSGLATLDTAPPRSQTPWSDGMPARIRAQLGTHYAPPGHWGAAQAIAEIAGATPAEAVITADSGAHRILLCQMWQARHPRAILQSSGLGTMGCALPLGIGYKCIRPDVPVVVFTGDAGLEMTLGEMASLRDLDVPVVVVVFVDRSLALIELKQRRMQLGNRGVDFPRTDFAGLARLYGGHGITVRGPGEAAPAMAQALAAKRFSLIEIEIPRQSYDGLI